MNHRRLHPGLCLIACAAFAPRVHAEPSATDRSVAQSLFEQGKQLMQRGDFREACAKLEESQRLDPGGGTALNLALCHEQEGKLAAAWTDFKTALSLARRDGREDRVREAEQHIAALEPRLPHLVVSVPHPVNGEQVAVDGAELGQPAWGLAMAVDPGAHELTATAPGHSPWSTSIALQPGAQQTVEIPALAPAPDAPAKPTAPAAKEPGSNRHTVGWVVGGVGLASLGVGSYFGIQALSKKKQSDDLCPTATTCKPRGVDLMSQANTAAWVANVGVGLGLVGVAVGGYLLLTEGSAPPAERTARRWAVDAAPLPGGGRVEVGATW